MNRTFKVVFSKVRGTMVVASEAAATPHKKAAKTVIAAAAALAMGTAMAQEWVEAPTADDGALVLEQNQSVSTEDLQKYSQFVYTRYTETKEPGGFYGVSEGDSNIFDKQVWVTAEGAETQSHALHAQGQGVKLTNTGKIYVQAGTDAKSWKQKGMIAGNGATVINEGQIVAQKAYGMTVEKNDEASHVINDVNGTITVLEQGAGIELGGASGSTAVNNGTITASSDGDWAHGVLIKAPEFNASYTFTNNGRIVASGDATAIDIQEDNGKGQTEAVINLIEGSQIDGIVHVGEGTKVTLNAQGTHDSFRLESQSDDLTINVSDRAEITLEDDDVTDNGALISSVVIDDGRLNASIWQQDNKFKDVTVNEDGIFNIKALNSKTSDALAENDRLLVAFGNNWTLNGGKLYVEDSEYHGDIKVGVLGDKIEQTDGSLTIAGGDYSFGNMEVGSTGSLVTRGDASLRLDSLTVYKMEGSAQAKISVVENSELTVDNITFEDSTGKLTVSGGTLNTTADSLLGEEGLKNNFELTSGTVGISDALDLAKWNVSGFEKVTVVADEVVATTGEGQQVEITEIDNDDLSTNVENVTAVDGIVYGSAVLNVQLEADNAASLHEGLTGVQTVALTPNVAAGDAKQTLNLKENFRILGNGTEVITGSNEGTTVNVGTYTLTLGSSSSVSTSGGSFAGTIAGNDGKLAVEGGVFNIGTVDVDTVNVGEVADLRVDNLSVRTATVDGSLFAQNIHAGTVTVNNMAGFQTLAEGATLKSRGDEAADVYIAKAAVDEQGNVVPQIQGTLNLKSDSYLTTNGSAGSLERAVNVAQKALGDKFNLETDAVAYVDQSIVIGENGGFYFGNVEGDNGGGVKLATNSVTVIDADHFMQSGESVFAGAGANLTLGGGGTTNARIVLDNLLSKGTLDLTTGDIKNVTDPTGYITSTNLFLELKGTVEGDPSSVVIGFNEGSVKDAAVAGAIDQILSEGGNRKNQTVINAIGQQDEFLNAAGDQLNGRGEQAVKEFVAAPVTAGTYNMAYDSMELISNALIQRNLDAKKGLGVWADVFYGSNESDSLYGDSGYSSDIYGGMLGVDFGFGEGARVGAALSIGSGDGDSEGSVSKYSTDSDFWGLSVYAGKDFGGLTFTGDMSYLWLDNDIGGSVAGVSASESLDSTVFSLGVRADWKAYEGKVLQVVPHAGVRWASIDVDDYRGLSMDKMNVIEMPIGVTVKGVFETASGWQVAPEIDFTAAPQIGDTEVETIIGDVDVIDNVYNASIGVNAGTDAVRFGLSYKYGFGNDGRSNNTFNLKASYLF